MAAPLEKSAESQFSTTFKQNDKEAKKQKLQGINVIDIYFGCAYSLSKNLFYHIIGNLEYRQNSTVR